MKVSLGVLTLLLLLSLGSCTSEYEERLEQARGLHNRLEIVQLNNQHSPDELLIDEINRLNEEINFLAKVSGNEQLFLEEIYRD